MKAGEIYGTGWSIKSTEATFNKLIITGGSITLGGFVLDENGFRKEDSTNPGKGCISADINGGTIGGWTIGATTIKGGDVTLDSKGTIALGSLKITSSGIGTGSSGSDWWINSGQAHLPSTSVKDLTVVDDSSKITIGGKTFAEVVTTLIKTLTPSVTYTNPTVTDSTGKACTVTGGGVTLSWS